MTKWEYQTLDIFKAGACNGGLVDKLNSMGVGGWECYAVDHGIAYLRRPKPIAIHTGPTEYKAPSKGPSV